MTKKQIAFWAITGLFCLGLAPSAVMNITQPEIVVTTMAKIDLPMYVLTLIGMWKILGIIALLQPRFTKINEWAYAGFFFDLTGASFAHAAGNDMAGVAPPLMFLPLLFASYFLRSSVKKSRNNAHNELKANSHQDKPRMAG